MRKLASIQQIIDIQPIPNADAIEVVTINGWKVVSKKGEFKVGELCIYFEIDSFLPCQEPFEFLRKSCYRKLADGKEGFRLKTIKLRGQISQGLALPTHIFTHLLPDNRIEIGQDVSDLLGVIKYDPPIPAELNGVAKGNFPGFIRKTDQERVQNIWYDLKEKHNDLEFEVTLKLDGSSATFYHRDGEAGTCSRNLEYSMDAEGNWALTFLRIADELKLFDKLKEFGKNLAIQGEVFGERIQGNPEKMLGQHLRIFDIFYIDEGRYLTSSERKRILAELDLMNYHIPELGNKKLSEFKSIEDLLNFADGKSLKADIREGIVFKSTNLIDGQVLSFKAISNQFLLNEK